MRHAASRRPHRVCHVIPDYPSSRNRPDDISSLPAGKDKGANATADYIIYLLEKLIDEGHEITDVYFFDHGFEATTDEEGQPRNSSAGMQLGDTFFAIDGPTKEYPHDGDLRYLAQALGRVLKHDEKGGGDIVATIHLRCCYGGTFAGQFADWSGLFTTGWTGEIHGRGYNKGVDPDASVGADYKGTGDYVVYGPGGEEGPNGVLSEIYSSWEYYSYYDIGWIDSDY